MSNVVDLAERRPHTTGEATCLDCKHKWRAVAPIGVEWMECPECGLGKGTWTYATIPEEMFECNCGNRLFYLMPDGDLRCPKCSTRHEATARD